MKNPHINKYLPDCECIYAYEEQQKKENEMKELIKEIMENADFPPLYKNVTLDKLTCENIELAKKYIEKFKPFKQHGLHFVGKPGNGKTSLAVAIGKEIAKKGYTVKFMPFGSCIRHLMSTYSAKSSTDFYTEANKLLKYDLLIFDDFGRECYKDKTLKDTFEFINMLYNNMNNLIITSNPEMIEDLKRIEEFESIFDRFRQMLKFVKFSNKTYRKDFR